MFPPFTQSFAATLPAVKPGTSIFSWNLRQPQLRPEVVDIHAPRIVESTTVQRLVRYRSMESMRIVRHYGLEAGREKPLYSHYCLVENEQKNEYTVQSRIAGHNERFSKAALALEIELLTPNPQSYDQPPPSYDDATRDLPPDYSTLSPLAKQKDLCGDCSHSIETKDSRARSKSHLIDLDHSSGIREHAKKKKKANQATQQSTPPPKDDGDKSPPPDENQNGGDSGSNGGGSGGGNGDNGGDGGGGDGGDDDGWGDAWNTTSKKKDKKKKKEEEERLAKEEAERKAKEEEEKKAAEETAANTNNDDLSWANDDSGNGDDSWADFAPAGKKKNKKKDQVRFPPLF